MTQEDRMEWKQMFSEIFKEANFATKDDLKNFATKDDIARLESRMDRLEERMDRLEEHMDRLEEHMDRLEERMDRLEEHMDRLEEHMDRLEERMDRLEERMDRLENYVHEKFLLIENEMMPKIDAMYEALTTRVSHGECNERMESIEGKADAITPLLVAVKKNTAKLAEHEERIKKLESPA